MQGLHTRNSRISRSTRPLRHPRQTMSNLPSFTRRLTEVPPPTGDPFAPVTTPFGGGRNEPGPCHRARQFRRPHGSPDRLLLQLPMRKRLERLRGLRTLTVFPGHIYSCRSGVPQREMRIFPSPGTAGSSRNAASDSWVFKQRSGLNLDPLAALDWWFWAKNDGGLHGQQGAFGAFGRVGAGAGMRQRATRARGWLERRRAVRRHVVS